MSDNDDFARIIKEFAAGRLAAVDLADIKDPEVRRAEAVRRHAEQASRQPEARLSIKELAAELGVSIRTLRRRNKRPDAPQRIKQGRSLMYRRADVQQWLKELQRRRHGKRPSRGDRPGRGLHSAVGQSTRGG